MFRDHLLRVFWRYNGDQNAVPTLLICLLSQFIFVEHAVFKCRFQIPFSKINSFDSHMLQESHYSFCRCRLQNFPNSLPKGARHGGGQYAASLLVLFSEYRPFPGLTGWAFAILRFSHSASSLGAAEQLQEQPKPQECQGDYWPMSNLLWSRGSLSSRDRFTFLTGLIKLSKSALPAEGGLRSH